MDAPLTVACVYRPGGGFTDEYPSRLRDAVAKHLQAPHRFVCLSNQSGLGVDTQPLVKGWKTWWSKLELFLPEQFPGRVVYFDLDTLVVGDITDICIARFGFGCPTNWKTDRADVINSAIMSWDGREDFSHIPAAFTPAVIPQYERTWERWGDQGFIQDHLGRPFTSLLKEFPGRIVHYKTHVRGPTKDPNGKVPKGASIVCFSGRPRPHEVNWSLPTS